MKLGHINGQAVYKCERRGSIMEEDRSKRTHGKDQGETKNDKNI